MQVVNDLLSMTFGVHCVARLEVSSSSSSLDSIVSELPIATIPGHGRVLAGQEESESTE